MRRFLIPEVIQTSAMDCGPAALKALLQSFGIHASYGRLREACQTEVDGTSIDALEDAARRLGLDAAQVMVPLDHLFEKGADNLPALVVVRQPNGSHHFVVAYRKHGSWLQVMDPGVGRRWMRQSRFLEDVYEHTMPVDRELWNGFAESDSFLTVLRHRMKRIGASVASPGKGRKIARLDAAARMAARLAEQGAIRRGREARALVTQLAQGTAEIPKEYWTAADIADQPEQVTLRGAVLLQASGRRKDTATEPLTGELNAALNEKPVRAWKELLRTVWSDGASPAALVVLALMLASCGSIVESLLLRGLYDVARDLTSAGQRAGALGAAVAITGALALLEFAIAWGVLRTGRRLDLRLRLRFLHKIPRLADRYFRSRPASDMAERSHNVHLLRQGPEMAATFLRSTMEMTVTVAAIAWFYPHALWAAVATAVAALGIPLLAQPTLAERDLKMRIHAGALMRFNLDALLGATAIRAHGASRTVRSEQNILLGEWARAGFALVRMVTWVEGLQTSITMGLAAWVVWSSIAAQTEVAAVLLLVYWVLNLPALGQEAASAAWQYPQMRNTTLRFVEPLGAPEEETAKASRKTTQRTGVSIKLEEVTVVAGGHKILDNVNLEIAAGEHVAIVGRSGAGKSSMVGLLLGWHRPSAGRVLVDGQDFDSEALDALRGVTAWADPQVQIWNDSLFSNLMYGNKGVKDLESVVDDSQLRPVLEKLPAGMQTKLGEGGGLVSGGEGQRVRMARAMARGDVRLAILDEPARGLDRSQRATGLANARSRWSDATMLCITHDVGDTMGFSRVLVIEDGRIAEDGRPGTLAADRSSLYRRMLDEEALVRHGMWANSMWRRMWVAGGRVEERERVGALEGKR